jgi:Asp-tRNA(Asn)/Glu-tRNA(Gln) amidotransferase A subunit family amidase
MMPLALGTQTGGSVLRPAAYCGIVGLKPTHGRISTAGVTPLAWSLDHVGVFARSVESAALAQGVLAVHDDADPLSAAVAPLTYESSLILDSRLPPRLGVPRWLYTDRASPEVSGHLETVASTFAGEGAAIADVPSPPSAADFQDAHALIMRVEAAAYHRERFARHRDSYGPYIRSIVEAGLETSGVDYARALRLQKEFRRDLTRSLVDIDALLLPVAPTPAPKGLESTGDPRLCVPGSLAGLPAISLPSGLSGDGLPLAVQLIAGPFAEARLLAAALWCEGRLAFRAAPVIPSAG